MNIRPNDLLAPSKKVIKPYDCSLIAMNGPNMVNRFKLCDVEIPFESEFSTTVSLPANSKEFQMISYGNMDNRLTFLAMNVRYFSRTSQNSTQCKSLPKYIKYYFESNPNVVYSMDEIMVLTASEEMKIEKIFIKNECPYDAEVQIMGANKGKDKIEKHPKIKFHKWTKFFEMIKQEDLDMICPITQYCSETELTLEGEVELWGTVETMDLHTFHGTVVLTGECKIQEYVPEFGKIVELNGKTILRLDNFSITDYPTHIGENVFKAHTSITGYPTVVGEMSTIGWTKDTMAYKFVEEVTNFDETDILFESKNILLTGFTEDKLVTLTSETEQPYLPKVTITRIKDEYGNDVQEDKDILLEKGEYVIEFDVKTDEGETDGRYLIQRKIY